MARIGIVLSVIWFVGFAGYGWFSGIHRMDDLYRLDLQACLENFDKTQNETNYEYCIDAATELYHNRSIDYKERIPKFLAVDFGVIALGWSIVLFGVVIARSNAVGVKTGIARTAARDPWSCKGRRFARFSCRAASALPAQDFQQCRFVSFRGDVTPIARSISGCCLPVGGKTGA